MIRWLFLVHRYLGMAIGLIMALWCLSGIVMMYVQYPEMSHQERLAGLEPLEFHDCCNTGAVDFAPSTPVQRFEVDMLAGRPVLRLDLANPPYDHLNIDLQTGQRIDAIGPQLARASAESFQRQRGITGRLRDEGVLYNDQWTVYPSFHPHRPLHKFSATDEAGTEWYVSDTTGEVVQTTTRKERFWNWMGAVVHWLYPTMLRQHAAVWYQLVVWLTIAGIFLTSIGLYIGVKQWKTGRDGRPSPYRGTALWHHYSGLFFGTFVLTWVVSGLFSMNPWGLLEGEGAARESARLSGGEIQWKGVEDLIARLPQSRLPEETVRLEGYAQAGRFQVLAHDSDAGRQRLDGLTLKPAPMTDSDWGTVAERLLPGEALASAGWLHEEDAYYYDHHLTLDYPVYRVVFDNLERSRYYLDAASGEIVRKIEANARWYRWLFLGLHRGDFSAFLRNRPAWDFFMLLLLGGVTVSCVTGAWMGLRRLRR